MPGLGIVARGNEGTGPGRVFVRLGARPSPRRANRDGALDGCMAIRRSPEERGGCSGGVDIGVGEGRGGERSRRMHGHKAVT